MERKGTETGRGSKDVEKKKDTKEKIEKIIKRRKRRKQVRVSELK